DDPRHERAQAPLNAAKPLQKSRARLNLRARPFYFPPAAPRSLKAHSDASNNHLDSRRVKQYPVKGKRCWPCLPLRQRCGFGETLVVTTKDAPPSRSSSTTERSKMSAKLGEILVRENLLTPQQLREALEFQREHGGRLGFNLVMMGLVTDDMITAVLSRQYGVPSVNLELFDIDESVIRLIPREVADKYSVLPLSRVGATLTLAMVDPTNVFAMDDIKFMTGLNVEPVVVAEASVQASIARYYSSSREIELAHVAPDFAVEGANGNGFSDADLVTLDNLEFDQESVDGEVDVLEDNEEIDLSSLARMSEDAPVVRLVNVLLVDALRRGASDIHVEPYEKELRIR